MPLFESQAVATVHRYSHAALYFPGDLVGPDPSSAVLPSVLYFPGRCGHAASASTATAGPIGPTGPVGPIGPVGPRRCSQIIISRLEELHPGPGKKDCLFQVIGSAAAARF